MSILARLRNLTTLLLLQQFSDPIGQSSLFWLITVFNRKISFKHTSIVATHQHNKRLYFSILSSQSQTTVIAIDEANTLARKITTPEILRQRQVRHQDLHRDS